jgi:arylsulfatase A-like enzyme
LVTLCIAIAAVVICACAPADDARPTVGVILISLDTLRADHLGCYGGDRPTSPFLDELADRGVLFENTVVQVPGTLPSHMTMLTGLLPAQHAVLPPDGVLSDDIPLLQERLAGVGVRTAGFTEGGYVSGRFGFSRGFEVFSDDARKSNTDIEDVFQRGVDFLRSLGDDDRFFLFLHTYAIHDPYYPPPPYTDRYLPDADDRELAGFEPYPLDGLRPPGPELRRDQRDRHRAAVRFVRDALPEGAPMPTGPNLVDVNRGRRQPPSDEVLATYTALYDATINYVDDVLRSLFFRLGELGLADRTIVIITSDHGEEFLEHGRLTHEQVYDECLRVPLLVVGPAVATGRRIPELVMTVDMTPTILDLLDVPSPGTLAGRSLVPALRPDSPVIDDRDAHAVGIVDPSEALYRHRSGELYQIVVHRLASRDGFPWIEREVELESFGATLELEILSYHRRRAIEVEVDGAAVATLDVGTSWQPVSVPLGADGTKHVIRLRSATCDSPAEVAGSRDTRCLGFRIRGFPDRRTELYNLDHDPRSATDLSVEAPGVARELLDGLDAFRRAPVAAASSAPLDEATLERLRELGYIQ